MKLIIMKKQTKEKNNQILKYTQNKQTQETQCFPLPPISGNCKVLCNKSNKKKQEKYLKTHNTSISNCVFEQNSEKQCEKFEQKKHKKENKKNITDNINI